MAQITLNTTGVASNGSLVLQSNGTTAAVTVDTSQNVGIGTSSPTAKLDVSAANFSGAPLISARFNSSNDRMGFGIGNSNGFPFLGYNVNNATSSDSGTFDRNGYATRLRLDNGKFQFETSSASGTAGNAITFNTPMTLDASGNLLVNRTTQFLDGQYSSDFNGNTKRGATYNNTFGNSGANFISFGTAGTEIGGISQVSSTGVLYNTTSDQRLKENIQDADSASVLIDSLQVRQFDWKSDNSHQRYGFIAQELVTVAPEAVHQPANPEDMMAVDYSKLVPMLVKEIQSLRKRLAALESA